MAIQLEIGLPPCFCESKLSSFGEATQNCLAQCHQVLAHLVPTLFHNKLPKLLPISWHDATNEKHIYIPNIWLIANPITRYLDNSQSNYPNIWIIANPISKILIVPNTSMPDLLIPNTSNITKPNNSKPAMLSTINSTGLPFTGNTA